MNEKVYDKAVRLLAVRLHTTGELYQKLKQRGFKDADIRDVLRQLEEQKFLDDQRFAEIFVDNLKRYKDFGYYGIKAKLLQRKIDNAVISAALAEFFTMEEELSVARRFIGKLRKQGRKEIEKQMRSLAGKGFRGEVIRAVISPPPGGKGESERG